jgi:NAD(P)-dependent dehydrogenase (short-subunit alcohol dehydrogenase family)
MRKTILLTGSTDGIGLETAKMLAGLGHHLLLHGRNPSKLKSVERSLLQTHPGAQLVCYEADFSRMADVIALARQVKARHTRLDVIINNAGVLNSKNPRTTDGFDIRFAVNTFAPYLLTRQLLPVIAQGGRIINVSSAGQLPVDLAALAGEKPIKDDYQVYAQSKLALNMWSRQLANQFGDDGPIIVAVNPGSLLATKMVKEGFGVDGADISIGADILVRAAMSGEFSDASGRYYDNDSKQFAQPHADALDAEKSLGVVRAMESALAGFL